MTHVCVKCLVEMRCKKNEVSVSRGRDWWYADLWECPECGMEIIAGFGQAMLVGDFTFTDYKLREQKEAR